MFARYQSTTLFKTCSCMHSCSHDEYDFAEREYFRNNASCYYSQCKSLNYLMFHKLFQNLFDRYPQHNIGILVHVSGLLRSYYLSEPLA